MNANHRPSKIDYFTLENCLSTSYINENQIQNDNIISKGNEGGDSNFKDSGTDSNSKLYLDSKQYNSQNKELYQYKNCDHHIKSREVEEEVEEISRTYQNNSVQCSFTDFIGWNCENTEDITNSNRTEFYFNMPPINIDSVAEPLPLSNTDLVSYPFLF